MNSIFSAPSLRHQSISPGRVIQQVRHATLIKRPIRPYTFTQLVTLSDGSTFTHRTTSPAPVYRTTKDTKNTPLWNPSSQKLLNVEEDEAGRLRRFRARFGRGFDAEAKEVIVDETSASAEADAAQKKEATIPDEREESLMDLIGGAFSASANPGLNTKKDIKPSKKKK